jgi:DNA-binding response OmpR family regulator
MAQPKETWFDRQVLEKIIINLLSNSFKYTPAHGEITLEIYDSLEQFKPSFRNELKLEANPRKGSFLYFRIADNGIGISGESIAHLFERYYRVSEAHMGSGIGLAFVKTLTQLHRGNIYVYSEREKGTEFIIGIPVGPDQYAANEKWTGTSAVDSGAEGNAAQALGTRPVFSLSSAARHTESAQLPLILIADDHEELRGFLKESLEGEFQIMEAANGRQALETCQEYFPDIVISDIMMPEMDGIEFCRALKANEDLSHIPFILLTARSSMEARLEGTGSGADHYFAKPVNTELLIFTIRNILLQKQKLRERYRRDQHAELRELAHTHKDREFLDDLLRIIEAHLSSPDLDVDFICAQVGMSRTKLYHKVKNITGQSIGDFIRSHRLRHAAKLMTETDLSLTDIMYNVGIQTQSYFSKAFKQEFGKTPTQFLKELETGRMSREAGS